MFEAIIASAMMAAAAATLANIGYTSSAGSYNPSYGNMAYDFVAAFYGNATVSSAFTGGNGAAARLVLGDFQAAYGLSYARLSMNSMNYSSGNESLCRRSLDTCFPVASGGNYSVACLYECGG